MQCSALVQRPSIVCTGGCTPDPPAACRPARQRRLSANLDAQTGNEHGYLPCTTNIRPSTAAACSTNHESLWRLHVYLACVSHSAVFFSLPPPRQYCFFIVHRITDDTLGVIRCTRRPVCAPLSNIGIPRHKPVIDLAPGNLKHSASSFPTHLADDRQIAPVHPASLLLLHVPPVFRSDSSSSNLPLAG